MATASSYAPAPPEELPPPLLWGEPEVVRARLAHLAVSIEIQSRTTPLRFASSQAIMDFHQHYNGPLIALRSTLPPKRYEALTAELGELTDQFNQASDGTVMINSAYLLVVARKP